MHYVINKSTISRADIQQLNDITSISLEQNCIIEDRAFENCTTLTTIWGSSRIISIGNHAFDGCTELAKQDYVEFSSLTSIGEYAFNSCNFSSISIGSNCSYGNFSFANCAYLTTIWNWTCPTVIPDGIFYGCAKLSSIDISGAKTVGKYAFAKSGIKWISLSNQCIIEDYAFEKCDQLTAIFGSNYILSIGKYSFAECQNLAKNDGYIEVSSVVTIGCHAFEKCTFSSININSATIIGAYAFNECSYLCKLWGISNIIDIQNYAFKSCTSFQSHVVFNSCESIGRYAFSGCKNLESLIAPKCTFVDYNAFYDTKLWDVTPS